MNPGDGNQQRGYLLGASGAEPNAGGDAASSRAPTAALPTQEAPVDHGPNYQLASRDGRADGRSSSRGSRNLWSALGHDPMTAVLFGLLLAFVFGALGAVASLGGTTTYTSKTAMLIDDPYLLATAGDPNQFVKLDELRFKYAGLLNTDSIALPVASRLHLPVNDVIASLSAEVPFNSLLMNVDATASTPREAQLVSQAAANQLTTYVGQEDVRFDIPQGYRFTLSTIDPASAAIAQPPSKTRAVTLAIGLAILGFALGFLATQIVRYLR